MHGCSGVAGVKGGRQLLGFSLIFKGPQSLGRFAVFVFIVLLGLGSPNCQSGVFPMCLDLAYLGVEGQPSHGR